jgi:hypothetical protein
MDGPSGRPVALGQRQFQCLRAAMAQRPSQPLRAPNSQALRRQDANWLTVRVESLTSTNDPSWLINSCRSCSGGAQPTHY